VLWRQSDAVNLGVRSSKYTATLLGPIVARSSSLADVIRQLGLQPTGGNHRMIKARVRLAGLDTSHFGGHFRTQVNTLSREVLEPLVKECRSVAAVLAKLDLPIRGRSHNELSRRLRELSLDMSHFQGNAWSAGFTRATHPSVEKYVSKRSFPDEAVFVENGPSLNGPSIVRRLLAKGVLYRCAICGIADWCGQTLVLHLDHINGVHNDHRVENLRLLCPNCHSQTPTYCNRAREKAACYTAALASVMELVDMQDLGSCG
jgi:hypothetical protein